MDEALKSKLLPFSLTAFIITLDQITKYLVVKAGDIGTVISDVFGNNFLCIWHVRNKVIAFSLGTSLPEMLRPVVFILLPIVVLTLLLIYYFKSNDFTKLQSWAVTGIVGGGTGNLIDRTFRSDGVVDFISVKWFGLTFKNGDAVPFLGFERWPTFNVADASVVICVFIWLFSILLAPGKKDA